MTTLAKAVAIGDKQLLVDAPMGVAFPGYVKIDSEFLKVGGAEQLHGLILALNEPAAAAHNSGATVTFVGEPFGPDFAANFGGGGSGLPSQWTDGGHGDVTATVDDPTKTPITITPDAAQTEALLKLLNAAAGEAVEAFANGSINQYLTDPAVVGWLIKMAAGQTASPLKITDEFDRAIFDFDPVNGIISIRTVINDANTTWYAQSFAGYAESDLKMHAGQGTFELDVFSDKNTPANSYAHLDIATAAAQASSEPFLRVTNTDLSRSVLRALPSGVVISNAHAAPADGDLNASDFALWLDDTNGAAKLMIKAKSADGTVVTGSLALA